MKLHPYPEKLQVSRGDAEGAEDAESFSPVSSASPREAKFFANSVSGQGLHDQAGAPTSSAAGIGIAAAGRSGCALRSWA